MVLVNEAQGYRVCLECHETFERGDELAWMARHVGPRGCECQGADASAQPVPAGS